jgi:hypothetical protein
MWIWSVRPWITLGLYSWSRPFGLGLDLGLGRPGLNNITAEIQARLPRRNLAAVQLSDQHLLQCHEMTRAGQSSAADYIALALQLLGCKIFDTAV